MHVVSCNTGHNNKHIIPDDDYPGSYSLEKPGHSKNYLKKNLQTSQCFPMEVSHLVCVVVKKSMTKLTYGEKNRLSLLVAGHHRRNPRQKPEAETMEECH